MAHIGVSFACSDKLSSTFQDIHVFANFWFFLTHTVVCNCIYNPNYPNLLCISKPRNQLLYIRAQKPVDLSQVSNTGEEERNLPGRKSILGTARFLMARSDGRPKLQPGFMYVVVMAIYIYAYCFFGGLFLIFVFDPRI